MELPDLSRLDGYLPPELEQEYRQHYLKADTRLAILSIGLFCFLLVAFAFDDYALFGLTSTFYFLIGLRSLYMAGFICFAVFLLKNRSPKLYDWILLAALAAGFVLIVIISLIMPSNHLGTFAFDITIILMLYMGVPVRLAVRSLWGLLFSLGAIVNFTVFRLPAFEADLYVSIIALVSVNAFGILASARLYSFRRSAFKASAEQAKAELEVRREAEQWQTTFDAITDMVSIQDKDFKLVRVNKAYATAFKMKPAELIGRSCFEVVHGTSCPIPGCQQNQIMQAKTAITAEVYDSFQGVYLEVSCSPIFDETGAFKGSLHTAKDITQRKEFQNKLAEAAMHDALTSLPNRLLLYDRFNVAQAQAERNNRKMAVMMLDLDRFKTVNDTLGHAAGDELLKATAERLAGIVRQSDTVARLGGDEFAILMPEIIQADDPVAMAHKILQAFCQSFSIDGHELHISTSIGIAIFTDHGRTIDDLLKAADEAMYYTKAHGRNNYTLWDKTI